MKTHIKITLVSLAMLATTAAFGQIQATNFSAGYDFTLIVSAGGGLWSAGNNDVGQLGNGTFDGTNRPQQIVASGVVAVAGGLEHALFLKSDGSLWAMGDNFAGELGNGTFNDLFDPGTNMPGQAVASGVTAIAGGQDFTLFRKSDGSLWSMGDDSYGQLGDHKSNTSTANPEQILSSGVLKIAAGFNHSLILKSDHSVWASGRNNAGQLGVGTAAIFSTLFQFITNGVSAIAAGGFHSLALKSDGSLLAWGDNQFGQLGDGSSHNTNNRPEQVVASGVTAIAGGGNHSLFIKSDGSLWAMGYNQFGQLGDGTTNDSALPEQIVASGVTAIAAGGTFSLFQKSDGTLWAMGDNRNGQLGDGFVDAGPPYGSVVPEQIWPKPQPVLTQSVIGTDLQFAANCGLGGNFYLLAATNLGQWNRVATNVITSRNTNTFAATLTNGINGGMKQFFILQSQ